MSSKNQSINQIVGTITIYSDFSNFSTQNIKKIILGEIQKYVPEAKIRLSRAISVGRSYRIVIEVPLSTDVKSVRLAVESSGVVRLSSWDSND